MNFSKIFSTCIAILLLFLPSPTDAQGIRSEAISEGLQRDAVAYAEYFDTDIEEALRRLDLQTRIGVLDEALTEETADTFGGLWIDHQPEFRVVTLFTNAEAAREWISNEALGDLAPLVTVQPAAVTLRQLELHLEEAEAQVRAAGQTADLWINVRKNQVEILTPTPAELAAALSSKRVSLPQHTEIVQVDDLAQPVADIRGGRPVTGCTSGFAVRSSTGRLGLATAGHCPNASTYSDSSTSLSLISETYRGSHDVQWHAAGCGDTIRNQVFDGTSNRTISGRVGRSSQAIGTFVCKYGKTTGSGCGVIYGKSYCPSYVPSGRSTFITVASNDPITRPGDSGGPWYVGNNAYGVMSGQVGGADTRAIYMAVDYMSSQGYSVLNYAAGVNPYALVSCYSDSQGFNCSASGRSGTPPYTYSGWQYYGPATSWNGGGGSISGSYGPGYPGCTNGDYNSVTLQVTDACGRTGSGSATFFCPDDEDCGFTYFCDRSAF